MYKNPLLRNDTNVNQLSAMESTSRQVTHGGLLPIEFIGMMGIELVIVVIHTRRGGKRAPSLRYTRPQ